MKPTDKYKWCNHHHELSPLHVMVNFGDGDFVANTEALPILTALNDLGLRTRTHHVDENGGFISILLEPHVHFEIRQVHERDSTRTKYNGMTELLIQFQKPSTSS